MFFFCVSRPPPLSTLFPYTTLFRSVRTMVTASGDAIAAAGLSAAGRSCSPRAARVLAPTSWKARGARGDVSWKRDEQVRQVRGIGGVVQQRAHAEDLLDRPQRRAVRVVNAVGVPRAFRRRRQHDHPDGAIAACGLVPG